MVLNKQSQPFQTTFAELCEELLPNGKYSHLRLILTKNNNRKFGQQYLIVSQTGFGLVKLCDLDFRENQIHLELQVLPSAVMQHISFDIDDDRFMFLLVSWEDIIKMVMND
jgi:hypothetical protein